MRTNKRRNLTSDQWACIAVEADEVIKVLREKAKANLQLSKGQGVKGVQLIEHLNPNKNKTNSKLAELFNTNKTYVSEAQKYKNTNPEVFEKIKSGKNKGANSAPFKSNGKFCPLINTASKIRWQNLPP